MHFLRQKRQRRKNKLVEKSPLEEIQLPSKKTKNENAYYTEFSKLKKSIPCWDSFFVVPEQDRVHNWVRLEVLGNAMCEKYSWAVPDSRALKILKNFSPLIEIGAGKGYICKLLQDSGVDIVAFDREIDSSSAWANVKVGGPKKLLKPLAKGRNLLLCYPDEDSSLASQCLANYDGDYILHMGELITTGQLSSPQAPWGRTTSADFQVSLMSDFHCVLVAELPAFPFSRDCISVWKRTDFVRGKESIDAEFGLDPDDDGKDTEGDGDSEEDDSWASVPVSERLPVTRAAKDFQHLLE